MDPITRRLLADQQSFTEELKAIKSNDRILDLSLSCQSLRYQTRRAIGHVVLSGHALSTPVEVSRRASDKTESVDLLLLAKRQIEFSVLTCIYSLELEAGVEGEHPSIRRTRVSQTVNHSWSRY